LPTTPEGYTGGRGVRGRGASAILSSVIVPGEGAGRTTGVDIAAIRGGIFMAWVYRGWGCRDRGHRRAAKSLRFDNGCAPSIRVESKHGSCPIRR